MLNQMVVISFIQVFSDVICCILASACVFYSDAKYRAFFLLNAIAFLSIFIGDLYYDYFFRILKYNIADSLNSVVTLTMLTFQLAQIINWTAITRINKTPIISINNLPYLLFASLLVGILIYYFLNGEILAHTAWYQNINISLNMLVWVLAIICLSISRSLGMTLLALGCLLIVSAALTTDCLFMFKMTKLASATSVHLIWTLGIVIMACGFYGSLKTKSINFCPCNSIQIKCCSWLSITFLIILMITSCLMMFFNHELELNIGSYLWSMPLIFVFSMIVSVLSGNWFSNIILLPVNNFSKSIQAFNTGKVIKENYYEYNDKRVLYEFNILGLFIKDAFTKITNQLQREIKLTAQIAHDIRSPLAALESIVKHLPVVDEDRRVLIRDTISHIRDITNNLEKNNSTAGDHEYVTNTQIANLLDYVLSEIRAAFSGRNIEVGSDFDVSCYSLFVEVVPSEMKRILTNIINNACEAVLAVKNPSVKVYLTHENDEVIVTITDNGSGLSQDSNPRIFDRGFTTKQRGSGLGLFHARENLLNWNGNIELVNNLNHGCSATIKLPAKKTPLWFISNLSFLNESIVVCVDDSISISHAWRERFKLCGAKMELKYCSSQEDLINYLATANNVLHTFLLDYEFSDKSCNGLNFIDIIMKKLPSHARIFLVTSHVNEVELQQFCIKHKIYLIPKFFALKIPIRLIRNDPKKIILADNFICEKFKKRPGNFDKVYFYHDQNNLLSDLMLFSSSSTIYIQNTFVNDYLIERCGKTNINCVIFDYTDITILSQ